MQDALRLGTQDTKLVLYYTYTIHPAYFAPPHFSRWSIMESMHYEQIIIISNKLQLTN